VGVNKGALGLLAQARASGADFSRVATIGRYRLSATMDYVEQFLRERGRADLAEKLAAEPGDGYCEPLLKIAFGAGVVQSIDASSYENADIIHDMNTPIDRPERYSMVLDFGTLEHVFNVPVAFDNLAMLAAPSAHILHLLPSNNFVGHRFYQFSSSRSIHPSAASVARRCLARRAARLTLGMRSNHRASCTSGSTAPAASNSTSW
jgi:hypothetical protein